MFIVLLGPPGVGKGTQSSLLSDKLKLEHVSTGDILRAEIESETTLGVKAKEYVVSGDLVPDGIVLAMLESRINKLGSALLDGFPRTIIQAQALDRILEGLDKQLYKAVNVTASTEEIVRRIAGRVVCMDCRTPYPAESDLVAHKDECPDCGGRLLMREDDKPEVVRKRLEIYREQTLPLIDYYKQKDRLATIDGAGSVEQVFNNILAALDLKNTH